VSTKPSHRVSGEVVALAAEVVVVMVEEAMVVAVGVATVEVATGVVAMEVAVVLMGVGVVMAVAVGVGVTTGATATRVGGTTEPFDANCAFSQGGLRAYKKGKGTSAARIPTLSCAALNMGGESSKRVGDYGMLLGVFLVVHLSLQLGTSQTSSRWRLILTQPSFGDKVERTFGDGC
jgi:hypothetical protein